MSEELLLVFGVSFGLFYAWATGSNIPNLQSYPRQLNKMKNDPNYVPDCDDDAYISLKGQIEDPDVLYTIVKPTFYHDVNVDDLSCKHPNNLSTASTASTVQPDDETDPCDACTDPETICELSTNYQCVSKVDYCKDKWTCDSGVKTYDTDHQSNCYTDLPQSCFGDIGEGCRINYHCKSDISNNCVNGVCAQKGTDCVVGPWEPRECQGDNTQRTRNVTEATNGGRACTEEERVTVAGCDYKVDWEDCTNDNECLNFYHLTENDEPMATCTGVGGVAGRRVCRPKEQCTVTDWSPAGDDCSAIGSGIQTRSQTHAVGAVNCNVLESRLDEEVNEANNTNENLIYTHRNMRLCINQLEGYPCEYDAQCQDLNCRRTDIDSYRTCQKPKHCAIEMVGDESSIHTGDACGASGREFTETITDVSPREYHTNDKKRWMPCESTFHGVDDVTYADKLHHFLNDPDWVYEGIYGLNEQQNITTDGNTLCEEYQSCRDSQDCNGSFDCSHEFTGLVPEDTYQYQVVSGTTVCQNLYCVEAPTKCGAGNEMVDVVNSRTLPFYDRPSKTTHYGGLFEGRNQYYEHLDSVVDSNTSNARLCSSGTLEINDTINRQEIQPCEANLGCSTDDDCKGDLVCKHAEHQTCVPEYEDPYCMWAVWKKKKDTDENEFVGGDTKFDWDNDSFCGKPSRRFYRELKVSETAKTGYVKCKILSDPVDPSEIENYNRHDFGKTESPPNLCDINKRCTDNEDCMDDLACMGNMCLPDNSCAFDADCETNEECITWDIGNVGPKSITIYSNTDDTEEYIDKKSECYETDKRIQQDRHLPPTTYRSTTLIKIKDGEYTDTYRFHRPELYKDSSGNPIQNYQRYFHENVGLYFWDSDNPNRQAWKPGEVQVIMQWLFFDADGDHRRIRNEPFNKNRDNMIRNNTFGLNWKYGIDQFGGRTYIQVFDNINDKASALNDPVLTMHVLRHPISTFQGEFLTVRTRNNHVPPTWTVLDNTALLHKFVDFFANDDIAVHLTGHYSMQSDGVTIIPYQEMLVLPSDPTKKNWGEVCASDEECKDLFECRLNSGTNKCLFKTDGFCNIDQRFYCPSHQSCAEWGSGAYGGGSRPTSEDLGIPGGDVDILLGPEGYNINGRCATALMTD